MKAFEFAIAVADEADLPPTLRDPQGHKRKKEGDIVAVRPHPWNWGLKEIDRLLIVIVECDETFEELKERYERPMYENGQTYAQAVALEKEQGIVKRPVAKRRYLMPLDDVKRELPELDLVKVRNKSIKYQPFKARTQLVQKFTGGKKRYLDVAEVDCGVSPDAEKSIKFAKGMKLIKDRYNDSYIDLKTETSHGDQS